MLDMILQRFLVFCRKWTRTVTALSVSVFGGRIDKLTQAFVALEERVEDGNKALT